MGDKNVYACMRENGYSLGGEQSGHIIFGDIECTGDGIMTSLRVMEVYRAPSARSSPQLVAPGEALSRRSSCNVRVTDKDAAMSDEGVLAAVKKAEEFLEGQGRVLVRASGTEPLGAHPRRGAYRRALQAGQRLRARCAGEVPRVGALASCRQRRRESPADPACGGLAPSVRARWRAGHAGARRG